MVGSGGAGFPTHTKLDAKADIVIINGSECEPLLRVDQQLMEKYAKELLFTLDQLVQLVGAKEGVVALKGHYHDAIHALEAHLKDYPKLRIQRTGPFYPTGDEQVLVYEVTGRIVPEGGIPFQVGAVVVNVETALNLFYAIERGLAVTSKYVTLSGAVKTPKTVKVPIGTPVLEAVALAGGPAVPSYRIINGGPMMGRFASPDSSVTKTTKALLILPENHPLLRDLDKELSHVLREARTACMQCSLCSEVCPRSNLGHRLKPHKLMRMASYGKFLDPEYTPMNAFLCSGCRLCQYACVMNLQPWKLNGHLKGLMAQNGVKNSLHDTPREVEPFRGYKRYPDHKLVHQLGLGAYDVPAPLDETMPAVSHVVLPLRQSAGAAAEPVVQTGAKVQEGDLVARVPEGKLGANLHASIKGEIAAVTADSIIIKR